MQLPNGSFVRRSVAPDATVGELLERLTREFDGDYLRAGASGDRIEEHRLVVDIPDGHLVLWVRGTGGSARPESQVERARREQARAQHQWFNLEQQRLTAERQRELELQRSSLIRKLQRLRRRQAGLLQDHARLEQRLAFLRAARSATAAADVDSQQLEPPQTRRPAPNAPRSWLLKSFASKI